MAKSRLNLQAYQQNILDRLKQVADDSEASSSRLGIYTGGTNYLVALRDVSEVLPVPTILPVPLTQPWFLGMANVRGNLYALTDLAQFIGITRQPAVMTAESRILLVHADFDVNAGFLIDGLAGLRNIDDLKPLQMVADVPAHVTAHYEDKQHHKWEALDIGRILDNKEFLQVAA